MPPSAETTVAMHHDSAKTPFTLTPRDCATCWLSAVARMAVPTRENLKNSEKAANSIMTITKLQRWTGETGTGPRWNGSDEKSAGNGRVSLPHDMLSTPRTTLRKPKGTMTTPVIGSPIAG